MSFRTTQFPLLSFLHPNYNSKISSFKPIILLIIIHLKTSPGFPTHDVFQLIAKSVQHIWLFHNTYCAFLHLYSIIGTQISLQCKIITSIINVSCTRLSVTHERFHTYCPDSPWRQSRVSNAYSCAITRRYVEYVPKRRHQSRLNLQIRRSSVRNLWFLRVKTEQMFIDFFVAVSRNAFLPINWNKTEKKYNPCSRMSTACRVLCCFV